MRHSDDHEPVDRPLRAEPVRRDEVLIDDRGTLRTMPLGTWRLVQRWHELGTPPDTVTVVLTYAVGDPELWQPLLDELTAQVEQPRQDFEALLREHPAEVRELPAVPVPEICASFAVECQCDECGNWTLLVEFTFRSRVRVCSNRCADQRRNRVYREWRLLHPRDPAVINAARTRRRAEARAGRKCEHCGAPIEAARSTKRFCSDICRVAARRAARSSGGRSHDRA